MNLLLQEHQGKSGKERELGGVIRYITNYNDINLDEKRKNLICFVLDMVFDNLKNTKDRISALKQFGWTEKDIYEASMLGAIQKRVVPLIKAYEVEFDF